MRRGEEKPPVSRSRSQSQQCGSVSVNVGSFSRNVGRSQITVSDNLGPDRGWSQVRCPIISGRYTYPAPKNRSVAILGRKIQPLSAFLPLLPLAAAFGAASSSWGCLSSSEGGP